MKKSRKIVALIGLGAIFGLSSCISDKGANADLNSISELMLTGDLQSRYDLERHATLTINAPEVKQTGTAKPLTYEWEIDHKVVGREATLSYVCRDFGLFDGRLKITNGDEIVYREFKVNVRYSYLSGVYAIANKSGKVLLTYYPEGHEGKSFEMDVLEKNNEGFNTSGEVTAAHYTTANLGDNPYFYIAMSQNGVHRIYQLNANLMTIVRNMEVPSQVLDIDGKSETSIDYITASGAFGLATRLGFYHNLMTYNRYVTTGDGVTPMTNLSVAPMSAYWLQRFYSTAQGRVMFDNVGGRMIINGSNIPQSGRELFKRTFTGYTLVGITPVGNQRQVFAVLHNASTGAYRYWHIYPGHYPGTSYPPSIIDAGDIPPLSQGGLNQASIIRSWASRDLVYYTSGNTVYGYSVLSRGNFPTAPIITLADASETIVDMRVSETDGKLYIGANASSGDLVGSLYCYDLNTNELLWSQKNVTGEIREIVLRP